MRGSLFKGKSSTHSELVNLKARDCTNTANTAVGSNRTTLDRMFLWLLESFSADKAKNLDKHPHMSGLLSQKVGSLSETSESCSN
jgi:hypothetical protein